MGPMKRRRERERLQTLMRTLQDERKTQEAHKTALLEKMNVEKDTWILPRKSLFEIFPVLICTIALTDRSVDNAPNRFQVCRQHPRVLADLHLPSHDDERSGCSLLRQVLPAAAFIVNPSIFDLVAARSGKATLRSLLRGGV